MSRSTWKSQLGFVWAAVGSAIGLGSIWRFPYLVGQQGGALFLICFIICLVFLSYPVLLSEILIGRATANNPASAFYKITHSKLWKKGGTLTILTGFLISSFYSVIAGWTLVYFFQALLGKVVMLSTPEAANALFQSISASPLWAISYHFLFFVIAIYILYFGVQKGIEAWNQILMPMLFLLLVFLAVQGLMLPGASKGVAFLLTPRAETLTPKLFLVALGQAFFGLSLGQGTMITYGSYLPHKKNVFFTTIPILSSVVVVSLLAGLAIFPMVFTANLSPSSGPDLMFKTLPLVFAQMKGGYFLSILFFLLIFLAALTSQISALEPTIAYLSDEYKFSRHRATLLAGSAAFLLGIPSALSFGDYSITIVGESFFYWAQTIGIDYLVPVGGFMAVYVAGRVWSSKNFKSELLEGVSWGPKQAIAHGLRFMLRWVVPVCIAIILIRSTFTLMQG